MDNTSAKLNFLNTVIHHGLGMVSRTPNQPSPRGEMSHDKKLAFLAAVTKHGLKHLDSGGAVAQGTAPVAAPGVSGPTTTGMAPAQTVNNTGLTGSIGSALGLNNNFQAQSANIQSGTNAEQINQAYNQAQTGINNQNNVVNSTLPGLTSGVNTQQQLSNMLMNEANGNGPNPAQAKYEQNLGNIAKQQAGAIASAKGLSPGLAAYEAAQQGGSAMVGAAGQEATLNAEQQLAAQNNLQNLTGTQVQEGLAGVQGQNNASQNEQNILQNANTANNNANVQMQGNLNNVNSQISVANQNQSGNIISGIGGMLSNLPVVGNLFGYEGGKVPAKMADGGLMDPATEGPKSFAGNWLNSNESAAIQSIPQVTLNTNVADPFSFQGKDKKSGSKEESMPENSGTIAGDAMDSGTGEAGAESALGADPADLMLLAASGGNVKPKNPKEKAVVKGDDIKNDKIPAMLSAGEVVIDRDTLADKGPVGQMARAVAAHIEARNKKRSKK